MNRFLSVIFISLLLTVPEYSRAWGMLGHRVISEVATHHLSPKAAQNIQRVLGNRSMAVVSNWMDDIKSDHQEKYDTLRAYHYVSIPDGLKYNETNINPKGDAIIGLNYSIQQLKSKKLSLEEEEYYLKILIHLVGDLHQPLHVGRADDAGGNAVHVSWFGTKSNLHRVWDSDILNDKLYSYTELTNIVNFATKNQIKDWQASTIDDWVKECQGLRPGIYDFEEKRYWEYEYMYAHWETIKLQLLKGGIRLAGILNEIYG